MTTRPIKWVVHPDGEPTYSEMATDIEIVDECGGEFVEVSQSAGEYGKIGVTPEDWPAIRKAINRAIKQCRKINP